MKYSENWKEIFDKFYATKIEPHVDWHSHRIGKVLSTVGFICVGIWYVLMRIHEHSVIPLYVWVLGIVGGIITLVGLRYLQSLSKSYVLRELAKVLDLHYRPDSRTLPEGFVLACKQGFIPKIETG